jgi:hypothetical protein
MVLNRRGFFAGLAATTALTTSAIVSNSFGKAVKTRQVVQLPDPNTVPSDMMQFIFANKTEPNVLVQQRSRIYRSGYKPHTVVFDFDGRYIRAHPAEYQPRLT